MTYVVGPSQLSVNGKIYLPGQHLELPSTIAKPLEQIQAIAELAKKEPKKVKDE